MPSLVTLRTNVMLTGLSLEAGGRRDPPSTSEFFTDCSLVLTWVSVHFSKKPYYF